MNRLILFLPIFVFAQIIKFAPLPIDTMNHLYQKYNPMLKTLSKYTHDKYKFVYISDYKNLLKNFKNGKVDMIVLGALPYIRLKEEYKYAKPIVTFLNRYNKPYYTCNIITSDKNINSLKDISKETKIFLTNKLSTCGYLMTQDMFRESQMDLNNYNYKYVGSHIDVVFNVTLYNNSIGDVKSTIAQSYSHYIKTIKISKKIPEFSLIVNIKKISPLKIKKIISILEKHCKVISTPEDFYGSIEKIIKGN